jgi:hypothetical protein
MEGQSQFTVSTRGVEDELLGPPRTMHYRPTYISGPLWGQAGITGFAGIFSLGIVDAMRRDPQVGLGIKFKQAPLHTAEFEIKASSPIIEKYVEKGLHRFWQGSLTNALECMPYGFCCSEVMYKDEDGAIHFDHLKPLHPRDTRPFLYRGQLAYVEVREAMDTAGQALDAAGNRALRLEGPRKNKPPKAFWNIYDGQGPYNEWYGFPAVMPAWWFWRVKTMPDGAFETLFKAFYKHSFAGVIARHPDERYSDAPGGTAISAAEYMQQLGEMVKAGANVSLSSRRDEHGNYLYEFEKYGGEVAGDFGQLIEYPDFLDRCILRGLGIPDEILQHEGSTGGYSRSNIAWLAFVIMSEEILNRQLERILNNLFRPLVALNFGKNAKFEVKPKPLLPDQVQQQGAPQPGEPGQPPPEGEGGEGGGGPQAMQLGMWSDEPLEMATLHAPKHGVIIQGTFYPGGEFIPPEVEATLTPEQKAKFEKKPLAAKAKSAAAATAHHFHPKAILDKLANIYQGAIKSPQEVFKGIKDPAGAVRKVSKVAIDKFTPLQQRYGRAAAVAMIGAWVGLNVLWITHPKIGMTLAPEPMLMVTGLAEAVIKLRKIGKPLQLSASYLVRPKRAKGNFEQLHPRQGKGNRAGGRFRAKPKPAATWQQLEQYKPRTPLGKQAARGSKKAIEEIKRTLREEGALRNPRLAQQAERHGFMALIRAYEGWKGKPKGRVIRERGSPRKPEMFVEEDKLRQVQPAHKAAGALRRALNDGTVAKVEPLARDSRGASRVEIVTMEDGTVGVWKPEAGQSNGGRIDISGHYYAREAGAYEIAKILGMGDLVPVTIVRHINGEIGSLQHFVEPHKVAKEFVHDDPRQWDGERDFLRTAAFDYVIGNTDRHRGNWLLRLRDSAKAEGMFFGEATPNDLQLVLIDHSLSFPASKYPVFVSAHFLDRAWNGTLETPGEEERPRAKVPAAMKKWREKWPEIRSAMVKLKFHKLEIAGVKSRLDNLAEAEYFPWADGEEHADSDTHTPYEFDSYGVWLGTAETKPNR